MFKVRPYPSEPSIYIHFDGSSMRDGYPAALEIAHGKVLINRESFAGPAGGQVSLLAPEAGALALTSLGMENGATADLVGKWFDTGMSSVNSMYQKLGVVSGRYHAGASGAAFAKNIFLPFEPPCLSSIKATDRQLFLELTPELSTGDRASQVAERLRMSVDALYRAEHRIAEALHLGFVDWPGAVLVTLAGAGEVLPGQESDDPSKLFQLPTSETQKIIFNPTDNPFTTFRFAGQPLNRSEPDMHTGYIDEVRLCGAVINVNDVSFQNYAGAEVRLAPIEMAALLLRCVWRSDQVIALTGANSGSKNGKRRVGPLLRAYDKFLPPALGNQRNRSIERSLRVAFENNLLTTSQRANITQLGPDLRSRVYPIGEGLAEGKGDAAIGDSLGFSASYIKAGLTEIRDGLGITTAGVALIAEANKWFARPDSDPGHVSQRTRLQSL